MPRKLVFFYSLNFLLVFGFYYDLAWQALWLLLVAFSSTLVSTGECCLCSAIVVFHPKQGFRNRYNLIECRRQNRTLCVLKKVPDKEAAVVRGVVSWIDINITRVTLQRLASRESWVKQPLSVRGFYTLVGSWVISVCWPLG